MAPCYKETALLRDCYLKCQLRFGKRRQNIVISSRLYLVIVYLIVAQLWGPPCPASKVSETGLQIVSKQGISEDNGETTDFGLVT